MNPFRGRGRGRPSSGNRGRGRGRPSTGNRGRGRGASVTVSPEEVSETAATVTPEEVSETAATPPSNEASAPPPTAATSSRGRSLQGNPSRDNSWHTVGIVQGNNFNIENYLAGPSNNNFTLDNLPNLSNQARINLEPGTRYKVRVAAINSHGIGEWSEISTFQTLSVELPGTPVNVRIYSSDLTHGARICWGPAHSPSGPIVSYNVFMNVAHPTGDRAYTRVYHGQETTCFVPRPILERACISQTDCGQNVIIFLINAINATGPGPAIQVKWQQQQK